MTRRSRASALALVCVAILANAPTRVTAQAPVTWLIFVDDLHLDFRNTGRIRDVIRTMTSELIQQGDRFAIASSGPSSLAVAATTDRDILAPTTRQATGNALKLEDILQTPDASAEVFYRASTAMAAARSMLASVRPDAGPTAMLYVSNGYSFDLLPDPAPDARLIRGRTFNRAEVREQLQQLTSTATLNGVRIFVIDRRTTFLGDPAPVGPLWAAHLTEMRRVLQGIAEVTGGFAIVDGELTAELKRVGQWMGR